MPRNHGHVELKLFLTDTEDQPLIVAFGGSEGGNVLASDQLKQERDKFLERGYAFLEVACYAIDPVVVCMIPVVRKLVREVHINDHATGHGEGQTKDVDKCAKLVSQQRSESNLHVIFDHRYESLRNALANITTFLSCQ